MAQSIKNRIFGDDIPSQIKQKLELRQQLAQSSEFGESINISDLNKTSQTILNGSINA